MIKPAVILDGELVYVDEPPALHATDPIQLTIGLAWRVLQQPRTREVVRQSESIDVTALLRAIQRGDKLGGLWDAPGNP